MSSPKTRMGPSVQLSAVVIRACETCQGARELGKPCAECGNRDEPKVTDLGVIASNQKSRWARFKWNVWGFHMAQHRIKKTNREMLRSKTCGQ